MNDTPPRNTPELINKVEKLRDKLVESFETLLQRAGNAATDRNTTAVNEYQMQIETATMIRCAEDLQVLIRQLQEMWLFGQLNTVGESKVQQQTDENAKVIAGLLQQLLDRQDPVQTAGDEMEGVAVNGAGS